MSILPIGSECMNAGNVQQPCNIVASSNHCIGTAHSIMNMVFRHIRSRCAARGGSLTMAELGDAQEELAEALSGGLDMFETIHKRCMLANSILSPPLFENDRMLSSLLYACSRELAHCTALSAARHLPDDEIDAFYDDLAQSLTRRIGFDVEVLLKRGYMNASIEHGQGLTIERLVEEQNVKSVLDECRRLLESPEAAASLLDCPAQAAGRSPDPVLSQPQT